MEILERAVTALEQLAKASMLQADLMAKMSYPAGAAIAPTETPTNGETKRTRRTKAEIEAEKAAAGKSITIIEQTDVTAEESPLTPEKIPTKEEMQAACKELVILMNGDRKPVEKIIQDVSGKILLRDVEPEKFPAIYSKLQAAIVTKKGTANG